MTKDVEEIIKSKTYAELTPNERAFIAELAENEADYNEMKWFLSETNTVFVSDKIQASPELKKNVMAHLAESKNKKGFWMNSVGLFLLPADKRFYQKPAFQMGIAAVAIVGFLLFFNNGLTDEKMAVNTPISDLTNNDNVLPEMDDKVVEETPADVDQIPGQPNVLPTKEGVVSMPTINEGLQPSEDVDFLAEESRADAIVIEQEEVVVADNMASGAAENQALHALITVDNRERKETEMANEQSVKQIDNKKDKARDKKSTGLVEHEMAEKPAPSANKDIESEKLENGVPGSLADDELDGVSETIFPKSLHINQTKELNALFCIFK